MDEEITLISSADFLGPFLIDPGAANWMRSVVPMRSGHLFLLWDIRCDHERADLVLSIDPLEPIENGFQLIYWEPGVVGSVHAATKRVDGLSDPVRHAIVDACYKIRDQIGIENFSAPLPENTHRIFYGLS
jgi:hypothetical protein